MHTSSKIERISEDGSRSGRCASFDFAQDEVEFDVPSTLYLILSEVEGRCAPMQCLTMSAKDEPRGGEGSVQRRPPGGASYWVRSIWWPRSVWLVLARCCCMRAYLSSASIICCEMSIGGLLGS